MYYYTVEAELIDMKCYMYIHYSIIDGWDPFDHILLLHFLLHLHTTVDLHYNLLYFIHFDNSM